MKKKNKKRREEKSLRWTLVAITAIREDKRYAFARARHAAVHICKYLWRTGFTPWDKGRLSREEKKIDDKEDEMTKSGNNLVVFFCFFRHLFVMKNRYTKVMTIRVEVGIPHEKARLPVEKNMGYVYI